MTTPVLNRVDLDAEPVSTNGAAELADGSYIEVDNNAPEDLPSLVSQGLLGATLGGTFDAAGRSEERSAEKAGWTEPPGNGDLDEAAFEDGKRRLTTVLGC
jgi:hypothetical protein